MDKMKIYFANGLFSEAERVYNKKVVEDIRHKLHSDVEVFLPQEASINDKSTFADSKMIAKLDTDALLEADVLVAVLDGVTIDTGVASEIGIFYTTGKPIIGVYTDVRRHGADNVHKLNALKEVGESQWHYLNLYTVGLVKTNGRIVTSTDSLIKSLEIEVDMRKEDLRIAQEYAEIHSVAQGIKESSKSYVFKGGVNFTTPKPKLEVNIPIDNLLKSVTPSTSSKIIAEAIISGLKKIDNMKGGE